MTENILPFEAIYRRLPELIGKSPYRFITLSGQRAIRLRLLSQFLGMTIGEFDCFEKYPEQAFDGDTKFPDTTSMRNADGEIIDLSRVDRRLLEFVYPENIKNALNLYGANPEKVEVYISDIFQYEQKICARRNLTSKQFASIPKIVFYDSCNVRTLGDSRKTPPENLYYSALILNTQESRSPHRWYGGSTAFAVAKDLMVNPVEIDHIKYRSESKGQGTGKERDLFIFVEKEGAFSKIANENTY